MTTTQPPLTTQPRTRDFGYSALLAQAKADGLLDRSLVTYLPRLITIGTLAAATVFAFLRLGDSWWQLAVAAFSGIVLAQLAFLGHDAGHQQVSRSHRCNESFGKVLATLGVGLSYDWWVDKHNRHHRHPNQIGSDPDVARGVLVWTDAQADRQRGPFRFIARHQAGLFFPLLLLEGWNLQVASVLALRHARWRIGEGALLVVRVIAGLTVLLLVLSPLRTLEFLAIQQAVLGLYLGVSFAPNHKGMPLIDETDRLGFAQRQVLTSRNIAGGRIIASLFGGLNYQIEHHLFPSMPSRYLRRCQPMVQAFCAAQSLPYTQTGVLTSYAHSLRSLRRGALTTAPRVRNRGAPGSTARTT